MPNPWTVDRLKALNHKARLDLYENARAKDSPEANEVCHLLLSNGLLDTVGGGLPRESRIIQDIEAICRSSRGIELAIAAAAAGQAPLAGVDPLLRDVREYGHFDTTGWAGGFVVEEIKAAGWRSKGSKDLPQNCIAKREMFFLPPEKET